MPKDIYKHSKPEITGNQQSGLITSERAVN